MGETTTEKKKRGGVVVSAGDVWGKRVEVEFDAGRYSRKRGSVACEAGIGSSWAQAVASGKRIFNASKFRLATTEIRVEATRVVLPFGLTDYREYVGTNASAQFEALCAEGLAAHGAEDALLSNAAGCEAALETSDGMLVMLRRSEKVATFAGLYNGPSGHAEPDRAGFAGAASELLEDSILAEIAEETGLSRDLLGRPRLVGVAVDPHLKPDLLFRVRADATAADLLRARPAALEAWESDALAFLPVADAVGCLGADENRTLADHPKASNGGPAPLLSELPARPVAIGASPIVGGEKKNTTPPPGKEQLSAVVPPPVALLPYPWPLTPITRAALACFCQDFRLNSGQAVSACSSSVPVAPPGGCAGSSSSHPHPPSSSSGGVPAVGVSAPETGDNPPSPPT